VPFCNIGDSRRLEDMMISIQNKVHAAGRRLAGLLVLGVMVGGVVPAALAEPADLKSLAEKPQDFLGQQVEMEGYCVKNGRSGDVLGYECTTEEGVYVDARDIEPESAKEKLAGDCAGGSCKANIEFVPHSYSTSAGIEAGKTITVFNAKTAKVRF
jgi:hypothetical protein